MVAEGLFKDKKSLYPHSIKDMFVNSRFATHHETMCKNSFANGTRGEGEFNLVSTTHTVKVY